jgi:hypothetical protein
MLEYERGRLADFFEVWAELDRSVQTNDNALIEDCATNDC